MNQPSNIPRSNKIVEALDKLKDSLEKERKASRSKDAVIAALQSELVGTREMVKYAHSDPTVLERIMEHLGRVADKEFPEIPKELSVSNLGRVESLLEKISKRPDSPREVKISNPGEFPVADQTKILGAIRLLKASISGIVDAVRRIPSSFKATVTGEVKVSNRTLDDAIPVVLASKDRRFFYDALVSVLGSGGPVASDAKLDEIIELLGLLAAPSAVSDGEKDVTTAGTAVQLSAASVSCSRVDIVAKYDNTGVVVVGGSTVVAAEGTRRGVPLEAGDVYSIGVGNLNLLWLDAEISGEGVTFTYYV